MATTGSYPDASPQMTTTTTTTTTRVTTTLNFDPSYIRTIPGILKIIQLVADLAGFISIMTANYNWKSYNGWYSFVSMAGFWTTGIFLLMYFFHAIERLYTLPWMLIEFIYCTVWCVFFIIASSLTASIAAHDASWGAASFFGFGAAFAYGYDAFLKFSGWRAGELAQGQRVAATTTQTAAPYY